MTASSRRAVDSPRGKPSASHKAARRAAGNLAALALLFLGYNFFGAWLPGALGHNGFTLKRVLSTQFGAYAAGLIKKKQFGVTVAKVGNTITQNKLSDIAGKAKLVSPDDQMIVVAKDMGVSFGDE